MFTFQAFLFQSNCRLFVFDTITHSWREKGRGILRLNDMCQSMTEGIFQSRLGELFFNLIKFFIPSRTIRRDWWIIFVDHFCWLSRLLDCFISFISQFFFSLFYQHAISLLAALTFTCILYYFKYTLFQSCSMWDKWKSLTNEEKSWLKLR